MFIDKEDQLGLITSVLEAIRNNTMCRHLDIGEDETEYRFRFKDDSELIINLKVSKK